MHVALDSAGLKSLEVSAPPASTACCTQGVTLPEIDDTRTPRVAAHFPSEMHEALVEKRERLNLSWKKFIWQGGDALILLSRYRARRDMLGTSWDEIIERGLRCLEDERGIVRVAEKVSA